MPALIGSRRPILTQPTGGGGWSPGRLGPDRLAQWYDANDAASVQVVGETITQIDDKSGNDRHIVQANGFIAPEWANPGAQYLEGGNNVLATAGNSPIIGSTERHVFVAVDRQTTAGGPVFYWGAQSNGQAFGLTLNSTGNDLTGYGWGPGDLSFGASSALGSRLAYLGHVAGITYGSQNGALTPSSVSVNLNTAASPFYLGARPTGLTGFIQALFREVVVVTGALSLAERQTIEGYMAWNNGLQTLLPSGHPYKSTRP